MNKEFRKNLFNTIESFDNQFVCKRHPRGYEFSGYVLGEWIKIKVLFSGNVVTETGDTPHNMGDISSERLKELIYMQDEFCPLTDKECTEDYMGQNACQECIIDWLCGAKPRGEN